MAAAHALRGRSSRHVPSRIDVTRDGGGGNDERAVLGQTIEPDRLYMKGRGYAKFKLFNEIVAAGSSYVCRIRDNTAPQIVENKPLTDAERHLLSHNQNGIEIQTYCAIIACLVIALWTGRKLTKQTHEMICFRMMGWVTTEEVEAHLAKWKLADDESAKKRGFDT